MQELKIFNNEEFGNVRTVVIDGEPWFVGKDVATVLGYAKPTDTVRKRVDDEDRGISKMETPSGIQELAIINESGLYSLIFGSKLESARRFKRWVTSEVLPSLRKEGTYSMNKKAPTDHPGEVARLINALATIMKNNQSMPKEIAENTKLICEQYGIQLIDNFVKTTEYEQISFLAEVQ